MTGPLSFMVGLQPSGFADFVVRAHPAGVYGLNNCPRAAGMKGVLRVQNSTWGRLPEACQVDRYFESQDPIASADYELLGKTRFVPQAGELSLIDSSRVSRAFSGCVCAVGRSPPRPRRSGDGRLARAARARSGSPRGPRARRA